jgi:hypothetical protein
LAKQRATAASPRNSARVVPVRFVILDSYLASI